MNNKQIEITPPEGYEIDKENSTFEKIIFKKVKVKPEWEDIGDTVKGYYVSSGSEIINLSDEKTYSCNKNTFPTKEEAEAALALSQLCQWRDRYNEGWKPNWDECSSKYCIIAERNSIDFFSSVYMSHILSFKTGKIRKRFYNDFKDLIEIAKPLL